MNHVGQIGTAFQITLMYLSKCKLKAEVTIHNFNYFITYAWVFSKVK